ncbi:uncharacterized protein [Pagrus major]|uniref:uncharacterized protein n=1 Tax=Pagrus major TaxID=143350 RepID=UPI003CC8B82C
MRLSVSQGQIQDEVRGNIPQLRGLRGEDKHPFCSCSLSNKSHDLQKLSCWTKTREEETLLQSDRRPTELRTLEHDFTPATDLITLWQLSGFWLKDQEDTETFIMASADLLLDLMFPSKGQARCPRCGGLICSEEKARRQREEEEMEKEKARRQREEEEKARRQREEEEKARRQREEEEKARRQREEEEKDRRQREEEEKDRRQREEEEKDRRQQEEEEKARRQREEEEKDRRQREEEEKDRRQREEEEMDRRQREEEEKDRRQQEEEEMDRRQREEEEKARRQREEEEKEKEKARIQREEEEKEKARRQREEEEKEKARRQREEEEKEKEKARRQREEEEKEKARRQREEEEKEKARRQREEKEKEKEKARRQREEEEKEKEKDRRQREEEEKEKARRQREQEEKEKEKARIQREQEEKEKARRQREEEEMDRRQREEEEKEKEKARIQREEEEKEKEKARRQREEEEKEKEKEMDRRQREEEEEEKEKARRQREEEEMDRRQREREKKLLREKITQRLGGVLVVVLFISLVFSYYRGNIMSPDPVQEKSLNLMTQTDQRHVIEQCDQSERTRCEQNKDSQQAEQTGDDQGDEERDDEDKERDQEEEESDREEETEEGTIRFALLNTRSMNNKIPQILKLITQNNLDVFLPTETFLKDDKAETVLSSASPEDFRFHSQQREGRGGGVAIQFSEELQGEQLHFDHLNIASFEFVVTVVQHDEWDQPVVIINLYHPPGYNQERFRKFLNEFQSLLDEVKKKYSSIIVTGDFNIHVNKERRSYTDEFEYLLLVNDLEQHVEESTHRRGNTLDLVITTNVEVSGLFVRDDGISDHYTVYFNAKPKDTRKKTKRNKNDEQTKRFKKTEE